MNALRLAVVTRQYWPRVGQAERGLADLLAALRDCEVTATVVTPRWCLTWSPLFYHQQTPVHRVNSAPRGGWSTAKYVRDLTQWIKLRADQFDLLLVTSLREEAAALARTAPRLGLPMILAPRDDEDADWSWLESHRLGRRVRDACLLASAALASTPSQRQAFGRLGFATSRVAVLPQGVTLPAPRTAAARRIARLALGEANHDLRTDPRVPVVLCLDAWQPHQPLFDLVSAWRTLARERPEAQLWIVGDGPCRPDLYEWVAEHDLRGRVCLPGTFDDWDDLLQAADVLISPSPRPGPSYTTLCGMAVGIPLIAAATADNGAMLEAGREGILVPAHDPAAWAAAVGQLLDDPARAAELGAAARSRMTTECRMSDIAAQHRDLFANIAAGEHDAG